eukprot:gene63498-86848_t
MTMPVVAMAQIIGINITIAPPELPVYEQPAIPAPGYIWTPGYWAYGPDGYYWVPGTWVEPPQVGLLWTPGYWGWHGGYYGWNAGYWGSHVGFYGGVDYGYGYGGDGYAGGRWNNGVFAYNRTVNNFGGVALQRRHRSRFAIGIERQLPANWTERALAEKNPQAAIEALIALARVGEKHFQPQIIDALIRLDLASQPAALRLPLLRAWGL